MCMDSTVVDLPWSDEGEIEVYGDRGGRGDRRRGRGKDITGEVAAVVIVSGSGSGGGGTLNSTVTSGISISISISTSIR